MFPFSSTLPYFLAGTPTAKQKSGISFVTTLPAATMAYLPIVTPQIIVAFAPMLAPSLIKVGR